MKSTTWAVSLSAVVSLAGCGARASASELEGAENERGDGGENPTLDAPSGEASGPAALPSTASLFLTIDNMEVRNDLPSFPPGSAGFWWPLGDYGGLGNWFFGSAGDDWTAGPRGDALPESIVPPRGNSMRARHVQGVGRANGAELSAQLRHPSNGPVDLRPYLGIVFWARLTSPGDRLIVALRGNHGGSFHAAESTNSPDYAQSVAVSDQWQRVILLFDDFHQGVISGNGSDGLFTADAVSTIDFVSGLNGVSFDLWIDDLALLCRGICEVHSL